MIKIKYKYIIILLLINITKMFINNADALNRLEKPRTLKECFKDVVPDIVPETPKEYLVVSVLEGIGYKDPETILSSDTKLEQMGPRDGEKARTYFYMYFDDDPHDYQTIMHIFVDGKRNQWLGEMRVNVGSHKDGTQLRGELVASDVFIYNAYPIYCELFGNKSVTWDVFLLAKQSGHFNRKLVDRIKEIISDRSHFDLKKFMEQVPITITHGTTLENYCNDSVKKNFLKNLLIGTLIMAAFGAFVTAYTLIPLWKARKE